MEDLKVVLAVPQYEVKVDTGNLWLDGVGEFASRHDADLVVFPEAFIARYFGAGPLKRGKSILRDLARKYNRATLAGFTTDEGYETALYYNPHATSGETREHLQYKHVIADRVAFVHPRWKDKVEEWFSPIHLKGYRIGVCICYEMFLSPVIQALENRGAQMYIDLTGDNVQPHKWKAIVGGRSIEAQAPFLCTMGYFATWSGKAISLAYDRGHAMELTLADGSSDYMTKDAPTNSLVTVPQPLDGSILTKDYSPSASNDITIALGTGKNADIEVTMKKGDVLITSRGRDIIYDKNGWAYFKGKHHKIALLNLDVKELRNRAIILQNLPKEFDWDDPVQHLVLFSGMSTDLTEQEAVALASLRVIEHQLAIIIFAGKQKEVLRQTKMNNVMRLQELKGLFGMKVLSMNYLTGPSFPDECAEFRSQYLSLLDK